MKLAVKKLKKETDTYLSIKDENIKSDWQTFNKC